MFSCLYELIWIIYWSNIISRRRGGRRPGLLRLLLKGKGDDGPRGVSSLSPSASRFPPSPHFPPSPPALSPEPRSILTSSLQERKRPELPPPPFPRKRRQRSAPRSSPSPRRCRRSPCSPCSPSSFLSYSPCYPHPPPLPRCVYCCVFPDGLIVVFV